MERYRTTIILVVVLLVLGGMAFFLQGRNQNNGSATPTAQAKQYVWQESNPLAAIDVVSGTAKVSLRQDLTTTVWSLVEPIKDTADPFAVGGIADQLKNLEATAVISQPKGLAEYGLDKSTLNVSIQTGGAQQNKHSFDVGNATVDGGGYYIKAAGSDNIYIISNQVVEPIKSWFTTPPKAQPTATPVPVTIAPSPTATQVGAAATVTATGTLTTSPTLLVPSTITDTNGITSTGEISSTAPGAANPTTPAPSPTK